MRNKSNESYIAQEWSVYVLAGHCIVKLLRDLDFILLLEKGQRRHHWKMAGASDEGNC
jgi:hypothetical protein